MAMTNNQAYSAAVSMTTESFILLVPRHEKCCYC